MTPPKEFNKYIAKTMLVGRAEALAKPEIKTGSGVKSMLEANEKRTRPLQKARRFSFLSLSFTENPFQILVNNVMPLYAKSIVFSMLTKRLSKIRSGSVTKIRDVKKATRFRILHNSKIDAAPNPYVDMRNPRSNPISKPVSVKPS